MATSSIKRVKDALDLFAPTERLDYDSSSLVTFLNDFNSQLPSGGLCLVRFTNNAWQKYDILVSKVNNNYGYAKAMCYYSKRDFRLSDGTWAIDT